MGKIILILILLMIGYYEAYKFLKKHQKNNREKIQ